MTKKLFSKSALSDRAGLWIVGLIAVTAALVGLLALAAYQRSPSPFTTEVLHGPVNLARSIEHHPLNIAIFRLVNHARHPLLDWITVGMTTIQLGWMLPVVFALTWRFRQAKLAPLAVALLLETALVIIVKKAFPQPRPAFLLDDVYLVRPYFTNAFPSGDVALMAVLAAILAPGERLPLRVLLWGGVALIAWQRMYIGVHFPLDCLGGIGIGIMAAVVARRWRQRRRSHTREPAAPTPALDA